MTRNRTFFVGFAVAALLLAGIVSYFAYSAPDGLDSVTLDGCTVVETEDGETLEGDCIAQHARDHPLADGPLADYTVGGDDRLTGAAGVIGVVVTLALGGGLFWVLRRRPEKE
jgi:cobalt/nickel transport protein